MIFENNKSEVLLALQKRGHSEKEIAGMSPKETFIEYCEWNGLLGWGEKLWNQVMLLSGNAPEVPALEPIALHGRLSDTSRAHLMNAINRAYGGRVDLENLLRGGDVSLKEMSDDKLMGFASSQVPPGDLHSLVKRIPDMALSGHGQR